MNSYLVRVFLILHRQVIEIDHDIVFLFVVTHICLLLARVGSNALLGLAVMSSKYRYFMGVILLLAAGHNI